MQIYDSSTFRPTLSANFGRVARAGARRSPASGAGGGTLSNAELKQIVADLLG